MKRSICFLVLSVLLFTSSAHANTSCANERETTYYGEHIVIDFPTDEEWTCYNQKFEKNGYVYELYDLKKNGGVGEIWVPEDGSGIDEKVLVKTSPWMDSEVVSMEEVLDSLVPPCAELKIVTKTKNEALISWEVQDEVLSYRKIWLTPYAFHSVSYISQGSNTSKVDHEKWLSILQKNCHLSTSKRDM